MAVRQEAPHLSHDSAVHDALNNVGRAIRKHPIKAALTVGVVAVAAVPTLLARGTFSPVVAGELPRRAGITEPGTLPSQGAVVDQRPTGGVGSGEGGVPGVLPDQPSQPSEEGPPEGGEGGGEGGNGESSQPDGSQTAGGGAVELPVSESTPEPQVAKPPVVRRSEVSRELVNEYPEGRADGSTVYVRVFRVTFSNGQTEDRYEIVLPAGSAPPPPPPVAPPAPAPAGQQETRPPSSSESGTPSYTDRGPDRKKLPSRRGEGIYDSPEFVDPPLKIIWGYIRKTVRLPNGHLGIIVRVNGKEIELEYITLDVANSVKKPKEVAPTRMLYHDISAGTAQVVPTPQLSDVEARLKDGDAIVVNVVASWSDRSVHGFGAPAQTLTFTGS